MKILSLAAVFLSAATCYGATILQRTGEVTAQCCEFAAQVIPWSLADTWTNVRIDVVVNNNQADNQINTGVFLLLNSLGPGTTEAANEIGDAVVAVMAEGAQVVTPFDGLTLGPGNYYLLYYRASHGFADNLLLGWHFGPVTPIVAGPGVTYGPLLIEDQEAFYRGASTYYALGDSGYLVEITGDLQAAAPIPEPATGVAVAGAVIALGLMRRRQARASAR